MKQNMSISKSSLPVEMANILLRLGDNIRIARKRRQWTIQDMASRMFVTRQTLSRLEHGDSGITLSVLCSAFWVLGIDSDFSELASPEHDKAGIFLERKNQPQRVRKNSNTKRPDF